jgi:hypothetical protein
MKNLFIIISIIIFISLKSFAQTTKVDSLLHSMRNQEEPALPTKEVINHIGTDVYIYDEIADYKLVNDTLKLLYIGEKSPNHFLTILIKGKKINKEIDFKKGEKYHFGGKAIIYKGKPAIIITNSAQLGTQIQI